MWYLLTGVLVSILTRVVPRSWPSLLHWLNLLRWETVRFTVFFLENNIFGAVSLAFERNFSGLQEYVFTLTGPKFLFIYLYWVLGPGTSF